MTFSAVTCLTYTGTTQLGDFIDIYSDEDGYLTPFQTNVPLSGLTAPNCPYYIDNVPRGSTIIRLYDPTTNCSSEFPLQSNNLCNTCDLSFDEFEVETVSQIVAGNLTGSCENTISDYLIHWYETGNTINPAYISGFGSEFTPYFFTHPLTNYSAIIAQEGTYTPIIQKVKVNDLIFSLTGGSGTIPAEIEDCFDTTKITVNPLTCSNGAVANEPYDHKFVYQGETSGGDAPPLDATFQLSANTKYVAISFKGELVPDRLTILYDGASYGEPIVLEDIVVGSNLTDTNYNLDIIPKYSDNIGNFAKILTLTGLTRSLNDSLTIKVTPNEGNSATNWEFQAACLESVDQTTCAISNDPHRIIFSSITVTSGGCTTWTTEMTISGCSVDQDSFTRFILPNGNTSAPTYNDYLNFESTNLNRVFQTTADKRNIFRSGIKYLNPACNPPSMSTISYSKSVNPMTGIGEIGITSNTISDIYHLNSKWFETASYLKTTCSVPGIPYSGTPFTPSNQFYYRYYWYSIPDAEGDVNCGSDGTGFKLFYIHPSSVVTTGTTGSNHWMKMTMPTIVNEYPFTDESCVSFTGFVQDNIVNRINNSSTSTTNNFNLTNTRGSRYVDPIYRITQVCTGTTSTTAYTQNGYFQIPTYLNQTIPFSGGTIQPSLSGECFTELLDSSIYGWTVYGGPPSGGYYNYKYTWRYTVELPDVDFPDRLQLYAIPYTGATLGTKELLLSYTGETGQQDILNLNYIVHDPSYFIM